MSTGPSETSFLIGSQTVLMRKCGKKELKRSLRNRIVCWVTFSWPLCDPSSAKLLCVHPSADETRLGHLNLDGGRENRQIYPPIPQKTGQEMRREGWDPVLGPVPPFGAPPMRFETIAILFYGDKFKLFLFVIVDWNGSLSYHRIL